MPGMRWRRCHLGAVKMITWLPGQQLICINDKHMTDFTGLFCVPNKPKLNEHYILRQMTMFGDDAACYLVEFNNPICHCRGGCEAPFFAKRFRPVSKKTIETLQGLLSPDDEMKRKIDQEKFEETKRRQKETVR